ncbi:MAG: TIGR01777 family oxidoreductase [Thalassolituus sp.]
MSKHILITGGTGFIGRALIPRWLAEGHNITVLTRDAARAHRILSAHVQTVADFNDIEGKVDRVLNLAGEGIADKRWSASRKQALRDSRIALTERLVRWAQSTGQKFELVLSGSAVGYYGSVDGASPVFSESSPPGKDFSACLCIDWEQAVKPLEAISERVVLLRTGIVLGPRGGMLQRMWLPFSLGLGGVIGSGKQVISWIHLEDYLRALDFLCDSSVSGPVNMTAPAPATNKELTQALASALHRPALMPMPEIMAKLVFGEMSDLLLKGQKVVPDMLADSGFSYMYPNLGQALGEVANAW